jgi:hypothetical protein
MHVDIYIGAPQGSLTGIAERRAAAALWAGNYVKRCIDSVWLRNCQACITIGKALILVVGREAAKGTQSGIAIKLEVK